MLRSNDMRRHFYRVHRTCDGKGNPAGHVRINNLIVGLVNDTVEITKF